MPVTKIRRLLGRSQPGEQLELTIGREVEADRNSEHGGRSFYFFDFDDNVAILNTPIIIFHKESGQEKEISSSDYAHNSKLIGVSGEYADYKLNYDDEIGSFRAFRDAKLGLFDRVLLRDQGFVSDVRRALRLSPAQWQGPSWKCFYHAVFNGRPISLITARGHAPETLKLGISEMLKSGFIPIEPNYLSLYPVSYPEVRNSLSPTTRDIAELKQAAIRSSVLEAFRRYGENPFHRFGMSDDDPKNLDLILEEMTRLKKEYPRISFFVISTHQGEFVKREVFANYTKDSVVKKTEQMELF